MALGGGAYGRSSALGLGPHVIWKLRNNITRLVRASGVTGMIITVNSGRTARAVRQQGVDDRSHLHRSVAPLLTFRLELCVIRERPSLVCPKGYR